MSFSADVSASLIGCRRKTGVRVGRVMSMAGDSKEIEYFTSLGMGGKHSQQHNENKRTTVFHLLPNLCSFFLTGKKNVDVNFSAFKGNE